MIAPHCAAARKAQRLALLVCFLSTFGSAQAVGQHGSRVRRRAQDDDGGAHVLRNSNGMELHVLRTGAAVQRLLVPDRAGRLVDVVLGFDNETAYEDAGNLEVSAGVRGRLAAPVTNRSFELGGRRVQLAPEADGGLWARRRWRLKPLRRREGPSMQLHLHSLDGEEGFPGAVDARVTYTLTGDNSVIVDVEATADAVTPIDIAPAPSFNLDGADAGDVLEHTAQVQAGFYVGVRGDGSPTKITWVQGSPHDLREPGSLGAYMEKEMPDGSEWEGLDAYYLLHSLSSVDVRQHTRNCSLSKLPHRGVTLASPRSGRALDILTTTPGLKLYMGQRLDDVAGKGGAVYGQHAGIAIISQNFPNAVNEPTFPPCVLAPGGVYRTRTEWRFYNLPEHSVA